MELKTFDTKITNLVIHVNSITLSIKIQVTAGNVFVFVFIIKIAFNGESGVQSAGAS